MALFHTCCETLHRSGGGEWRWMRGGQYWGVDWPLCVPPTVERDRRAWPYVLAHPCCALYAILLCMYIVVAAAVHLYSLYVVLQFPLWWFFSVRGMASCQSIVEDRWNSSCFCASLPRVAYTHWVGLTRQGAVRVSENSRTETSDVARIGLDVDRPENIPTRMTWLISKTVRTSQVTLLINYCYFRWCRLLLKAAASAVMNLVCLASCVSVSFYVLAFLVNKWWCWWHNRS